MNYHVVILGVKVNSWAWGLERVLELSKQGEKTFILDLGVLPNSNRKSPRDEFQQEFFANISHEYVSWKDLVSRHDRKRLLGEIKRWLLTLQDNENWVNAYFGDLPLGRILMSNHARTMGTKTFPLRMLPLSAQLKIATQAVFSLKSYESIQRNVGNLSVSNGRSPIEAGVLFGARRDGIKTHVLERGASSKEWYVWETSSHYSPDWWKLLRKTKTELVSEESLAISSAYWSERLKGIDTLSGRDWSTEFEVGRLPKNLPREYITFFCTSEHESPALPEFECSNLGFSSQQIAVKKLVEICLLANVTLVIKRHPNSLAVDGVDRESSAWEWVENYSDVLYIGPKERVDSYALISGSKGVVTFRSSVGIEAAALGVPSRAMGPAEWASTEECRAWTEDEVEKFVRNPTALINSPHPEWGYLSSTFGKPLKVFDDITGGFAILGSNKFFSNEHYQSTTKKLLGKVARKVWTLRTKLS